MFFSRIWTFSKALRQLGFTQVGLNALYRLGLASGHYKRAVQPGPALPDARIQPLIKLPDPAQARQLLGKTGLQALLDEAGEIVEGQYRQFGAQPIPIVLNTALPLENWSMYETGQVKHSDLFEDIKFVWEPARFGWAFTLGRAYHLLSDERYSAAFWQHFETFQQANPPYLGPNWMSGQEVGLRLLAWLWSAQLFAGSVHSTPARMSALAQAVAAHAERIPATLLYARSQNNNHLLTEAAALWSAGLALPGHPQAERWQKIGRRWLAWCFKHQIDADGEYLQHSSNYQRLMLQTALWTHACATSCGLQFPGGETSRAKLGLAAGWLASRLDPISGQALNLGANDGALIMPLANAPFQDFRPCAQAAARAFSSAEIDLPAGDWDETSIWFGLTPGTTEKIISGKSRHALAGPHSWGSLRAMHYSSRPSHADQLHFDLWWRGWNIALDPGTYRYNANPPWDNRLTSTLVHNTISLDGREQMTRAGRFLYLDWAEAGYIKNPKDDQEQVPSISAVCDAYGDLGILHKRTGLVLAGDHWQVLDELLVLKPVASSPKEYTGRLHWLLPDWEWKLESQSTGAILQLLSPAGWISLEITCSQPVLQVGLVRAGELIYGTGMVAPEYGWQSPTYNIKKPALSLAVEVKSTNSLQLTSEFIFPATTETVLKK